MKFITLNCFLSPWSPKRKVRLSLIVSSLAEQNPDIIFLQEVYFKSEAKYIIEKLAEKGFNYHFYSKTLLLVSKQPFLSQRFFEFIPCPSFHFLLLVNELRDWIWGKGFQVIEIRANEHQITLVNLHLLSRAYEHPDPIFWEARTRQLQSIINHISGIASNSIIMAGDFNFDKHSPPYNTLINNYGFQDPLQEVAGNTISSDNSNRKFFIFQKINQRIDHFFIKGLENLSKAGDVIFKEFRHDSGITTNISDHYGLILNIQ